MNSLNALYINKKINFVLLNAKYFFVFLIIISSVFHAKAQTDFRRGYYITLENDTIFGLLDYRGEVKNSQVCVFKKNDSDEPQKFNPGEIQLYRFIDGKFYVSKQIKTESGKRSVFLEFLVDGITNLYFLRDINNYKYYLEDKNGNLLELSNETITENVEGKGAIQRNSNRYIGVLRASFADCKEILPQINNVNLVHKSLINITRDYHNYVCNTEECIVYEKKVQSPIVRFAPVLKTGIADFHFEKGVFENYNFNPKMCYGAGFLVNTVFPGINEKVSFEAGLDFNVYKFNGSYNKTDGFIKEYYNMYFDLFSVQPALAIKYTFPTGTIRPTIAFGGYADIFAINKQEMITVKQHPDTTYTYTSAETPITSLVFGGFTQMGFNYDLQSRTFFTNFKVCYSINSEHGATKSIIRSMNLNVGMFLDKRKKQ
jgi:hypothetical protein